MIDASPNRTSRQAHPKDSAPLLAALGILAYAASMMTHEALGHGLYCVAIGGHNSMLTAWGERCDFPTRIGPAIAAAGPATQVTVGLLAWLALPRLPQHATRLRFFVWLVMVFNLFIASGYVAFSGVTGIGDAAVVIANLHPPLPWRAALILLGSVAYFLSMRAAAAELHRFAGPDSVNPDHSHRRLFRLVAIPYAAAGIFACTTAALNHTMGPHVALGFAAASSFGSGSGLFGLPPMQRTAPLPASSRPSHLTWSTAWTATAAAVLASSSSISDPDSNDHDARTQVRASLWLSFRGERGSNELNCSVG